MEKEHDKDEKENPKVWGDILRSGGTSYLKFPAKFKNIVKKRLKIPVRNLKVPTVEILEDEDTITLKYVFDKNDMEVEDMIFRKRD